MHGTLSTYLTFWHAVVVFLVAIFGIVAVRISFTFDLNKYLEGRRGSYKAKLRNACTHVELKALEDGVEGRLLFISPPGTLQWQCQRCGLVRYINGNEGNEMVKRWIDDIDAYNERNKKFQKLLRKSGQV
jgi:hypothetical protein